MFSTIELLATSLGFANIVLCIKESVWNWIVGIIMICLYLYIFFSTKLYADMFFQLIALILQFYGVYNWLKKANIKQKIQIKHAHHHHWLITIIAIVSLFVSASYLLHFTDSNTIYLDAFVMSVSLLALWMQSNKMIEHWLLWILMNCFSIQLYLGKELYLTTGLYFCYCFLNILGFREWKGKMKPKVKEKDTNSNLKTENLVLLYSNHSKRS